MIEVDYEHCTGCGACKQICPVKCISWEEKELGALYPIVDIERCINCHLCETVCPIKDNMDLSKEQNTYAIVNKDKLDLQNETSGGAFSCLADYVLNKDGVVYGVQMNENFKVEHVKSNGFRYKQMQGAKYVQSDTGNTFIETKKDLNDGRFVLFSGTPCQIAGLKKYLLKNYDNLLTVDIVCHGVSSQTYFDRYISYAKNKYAGLKTIRFRDKKYVGWSCSGGLLSYEKNGEIKVKPFHEYKEYYYAQFLNSETYRESCYFCKYATMNRVGDFTLGDFWGVERLNLPIDTTNGCSLVIANNKKAKDVLFKVKDKCILMETPIIESIRDNKQLHEPSRKPINRGEIINDYDSLSGDELQKKFIRTHKKHFLIGVIKTIIPKKLREIIRKNRK